MRAFLGPRNGVASCVTLGWDVKAVLAGSLRAFLERSGGTVMVPEQGNLPGSSQKAFPTQLTTRSHIIFILLPRIIFQQVPKMTQVCILKGN